MSNWKLLKRPLLEIIQATPFKHLKNFFKYGKCKMFQIDNREEKEKKNWQMKLDTFFFIVNIRCRNIWNNANCTIQVYLNLICQPSVSWSSNVLRFFFFFFFLFYLHDNKIYYLKWIQINERTIFIFRGRKLISEILLFLFPLLRYAILDILYKWMKLPRDFSCIYVGKIWLILNKITVFLSFI